MNTELINILRTVNLSEYESRVYLTLLEVGESTTGTILSKSKINSGKIYLILEALSKKGLVTEIVKNNVRHFRAVDPRSIGKYLDETQKTFDEKRRQYINILPQLLALASESDTTPEIRVYTGNEGMKSAFDQEIMRYKQNKELLVYGIIDYDAHNQSLVRYFTNTIFSAREKKRIKIRKIVSRNAKENKIEKGASLRYIDYDSYFTYNIIDTLVIFAIWSKDPIFITIISEEVSEGLRNNFNTIWKTAQIK